MQNTNAVLGFPIYYPMQTNNRKNKTTHVQIRTTEEIKQLLKQAAENDGKTMSEIIETLVNNFLKQRHLNHG